MPSNTREQAKEGKDRGSGQTPKRLLPAAQLERRNNSRGPDPVRGIPLMAAPQPHACVHTLEHLSPVGVAPTQHLLPFGELVLGALPASMQVALTYSSHF